MGGFTKIKYSFVKIIDFHMVDLTQLLLILKLYRPLLLEPQVNKICMVIEQIEQVWKLVKNLNV